MPRNNYDRDLLGSFLYGCLVTCVLVVVVFPSVVLGLFYRSSTVPQTEELPLYDYPRPLQPDYRGDYDPNYDPISPLYTPGSVESMTNPVSPFYGMY